MWKDPDCERLFLVQEEEAREAEAEITCPVDCVREVRTYAELRGSFKRQSYRTHWYELHLIDVGFILPENH